MHKPMHMLVGGVASTSHGALRDPIGLFAYYSAFCLVLIHVADGTQKGIDPYTKVFLKHCKQSTLVTTNTAHSR